MKLKLALAGLMLAATPAHADWYQADTAHFRVYSDSNAETAAETAVMMERLDEAMRFMLKVEPDKREPELSEKLTLFQFGTARDIGRLVDSKSVAGFFIPRGGNTVAFSPLKEERQRGSRGYNRSDDTDLSPETVLFHEYAHYFMFRHAPAAYPYWYREGFAEVYGTLELTDDGFIMGAPANHRAATLKALRAYDLENLFQRPEKMRYRDVFAAYAQGWLLSHYLTFSGERDGQLKAYLDLLNQRVPSLDAARQAFGDLRDLQSDMRKYQSRRLSGKTVTFDGYVPPEVTVREVSDAEAASLPIRAQSQSGVTREMALDLVDDARQLAANYPDSVMAQLTATEALFDARLYEEATRTAERAQQLDEESAWPNIYLGRIALTKAVGFEPVGETEWPAIAADPSYFEEAQKQYALANRKDPQNSAPLHEYYLAHRLSGKPVPETALIALENAYFNAQFDRSFRQTLGHLLLLEQRDTDALSVLGPVINDPHAPKRIDRLNKILEELEADPSKRAEALEFLSPEPDWLFQPDPEDEEGDDED